VKIRLSQLRRIIKEEIQANGDDRLGRRRTMSEGYNRITPQELNAWMQGDWGYMSDLNEEKFYDSSTEWAKAAIADGRTVGNLLDAYDDMTKVVSGVSGTDYQDLLPLHDVKLSDLTGQDRARAEELRQEIIMLDSLPPM